MRKLHKINKTLAESTLSTFVELFRNEPWFDMEKHRGFSIALLPIDGEVDIISVGEFPIDEREGLTQKIAAERASRAMTNFYNRQTLSSFPERDPREKKYGGGLHYASEHNEGFVNSFALAISGLTEEKNETTNLALAQLHFPESKIMTYYRNFIKRDQVFREGLINDNEVLRNAKRLVDRVRIPQVA